MAFSIILGALAEPNRQRIIQLLKRGEHSVSELMEHLSITMPTLSHHLDILKRAGLVSARRQGQQMIYSLNMSVVEELLDQLARFLKQSRKYN